MTANTIRKANGNSFSGETMKKDNPHGGPVPSKAVAGAKPYVPQQRNPGVRLKLDLNEGKTDPGLLDAALRRFGKDGGRDYPDQSGLEAEIARKFGVAAGRVVVGAGGDEVIHRLLASTLEPGRKLVVLEPAFEMFAKYAELAGAETVRVEWAPGTPFPRQKAVEAAETASCFAFVSPSNPTGAEGSAEDLIAIADACKDGLVILDSAYGEFSGNEEALLPEALSRKNVAVLKTFSKAYGMAGMRLGYAICPETVANWARAAGGPFPVSGFSLACGMAALDDRQEAMADYVREVKTERGALSEALAAAGFVPYPSGANFVLARSKKGNPGAAAFAASLARSGIAVRTFAAKPSLSDCVRISCPGDREAFSGLKDAILAYSEETK